MAVLICHARGGGSSAPGDQTGKEVCSGVWWNGGWTVLLRPKTPSAAEVIARFAERAAANENVGYSQADRNSLRTAARCAGFDAAKIDTPCNCDCSSFATVCAEAAGIDVPYVSLGGGKQNAPVTWTMRDMFALTGQFEVLTDSKYLTGPDYLKRGDILVNEPQATGHAIVVTGSASPPSGENAEPVSGNGDKALVTPAEPSQTQTANAAGTEKPVTSSHKTHTVAWGDTLWDIARTYGTTVDRICQLNELDPERFIYPGQVIVIPN